MPKTLTDWIENQQLEEIFPSHYFSDLKLLTFPAGQAICLQGDDLDGIFYVVQGKVKIVRQVFNGKEYILDILDTPTLIGDVELLTQQQIVSSVIALEETICLQLPLAGRKEQLLADPLFLLKIGQGLAQSLYQQNIRSSTNLTYTVKERLATHILAIEKEGRFKLELATLADSFGIHYRHLLRVIRGLINQQIISKDKPFYQIENRQQLQDWIIKD